MGLAIKTILVNPHPLSESTQKISNWYDFCARVLRNLSFLTRAYPETTETPETTTTTKTPKHL